MEKVKKLLAVAVGALVITGCAPLEETRKVDTVQKAAAFAPEKLVIANFDSGLKPSNLGGDFGAWDKDPNDSSQTCVSEFDSVVKTGDYGFSMKLVYDVDSPQPAYNGFWMKLEKADFTPYKNLVVSLKGDEEKGFTNKIVLELKNAKGKVGKALVSVTGEWQEKTIPLSAFSGITDLSQMTELVVVFDDNNSNPKTGVIYIDNIYVKK